MDQITRVSQIRDMLTMSSATMQTSISESKLDYETKRILDSIAQETHYVLSAIIEYLENNYFFLRRLPQ